MNALDTAWGIRAPTAARGRVVSFDVRKTYRKGSRDPEIVTRGTPMPMSLAMIAVKLMGV